MKIACFGMRDCVEVDDDDASRETEFCMYLTIVWAVPASGSHRRFLEVFGSLGTFMSVQGYQTFAELNWEPT